MKKKYQQPFTELLQVDVESFLLTTSPDNKVRNPDHTGTGTTTDTGNDDNYVPGAGDEDYGSVGH